jgi:ferrous iron transport protein A
MSKATPSLEPQKLRTLKKGIIGIIRTLPSDPERRSQCIRLGLTVGARISCLERLPGGTIVLATARQEIALGKGLTEEIEVVVE